MTDHPPIDTSSYFDCYQQHQLPLQYTFTSSSNSNTSNSSTSPSHISDQFSSSGGPPYELSSHILTPSSVIPTPSPSVASASISSPTIPAFGCTMSEYSMEQMEAISTSLFQARDGDRLVAFFKQLESLYGPNAVDHLRSEAIIVAYTYALYHSNEFETLFHLLSNRHFQQRHYNDLQDIWHHARYKESQLKRGKELNPVEKYRLRRKFPAPKTIWDGEEIVYSFKDSSRKFLKQFFRNVSEYPTQEQKREISRATGLKIVQISNWFKNRRQRDKSNNSAKCSPPSSSSSTNGGSDFLPIITPQSFNLAAAPFNMNMIYGTLRDSQSDNDQFTFNP
ncbi:Homeobox protein unc-39 [Caenorhabditis elegans]|uniref:Homeobox protein unc-39 n=1 Tax=Caenorhabditis elegans TaxID=6239 RepID=HM35_CAEEL|nr:Homeobox protein unc-39 [Caenorhabditis elegans]O17894.2 RecName: Full=Homeobox protein unc-39; AltName: Full=Homeobox protein ceh-35; AltName: Full=Uncoordinated protein 39 [Caenorhabditis elegans]CAB04483.2 Homeobox protein unc-39 [Caenorhabditis elegans]|eukprot:NP_506563.2 Uncharacterized protein CELE_F56A12.1 [Caenorhabditis elegans]